MKLLKTETVQERFNRKVVIRPGCWKWNGSKKNFGYGTFMLHYKVYTAHRISYEIYVGNIPSGLHVLHRCDNPECANPDHLFLGTHQDNMIDKTVKGRAIGAHAGGKNHNAKLTDAQVLEIRKDVRSNSKTAISYGVTKSTITQIRHRDTWNHI